MRPIHKPKTRAERRHQRHLRVRKKVTGTTERPRLVVYRSIKHIYARLVDDGAQRTILTVSDQGVADGKKTQKSVEVGKRLAAKAKDAGLSGDEAMEAAFEENLRDTARVGGG